MYKKKVIYGLLFAILFVTIILTVFKSIKTISYNEPCDCKMISNDYDIEVPKNFTCYYGRNGLGQIKGYLVNNQNNSFMIFNDNKDNINHQFKKKLQLIDTFETTYKNYKLTIEFYTYKTNQSNKEIIDIYNIYYLEKEDHVIYGSVSKIKANPNDDYKNLTKDEIELLFDEIIC